MLTLIWFHLMGNFTYIQHQMVLRIGLGQAFRYLNQKISLSGQIKGRSLI